MSKERAAQLVDAGIWLKLSGDREGARKLFERALKLDPENAKAAQLLAGGDEPPPPPPSAPGDVPIAPAIAPVAQPVANPFEPPSASPPGPNERDWNLATQKPAPAPLEPSLDADWGRLTGASTPVPQAPPPGSEIPAPRSTMPGWASPPSSSNIRIGSNTPEPAPPPAPITSSPSQPRNPTMMQWNSPLPQPAPLPIASSPSGTKRPTMSDWGTQVKFDSPPPIAPVLPVAEASPSGPASSSPSRQTMAEWGSSPEPASSPSQTMASWGPPVAEASPSGPASSSPSRQTMAEWGSPPVAESGPASSPSRQTMAEWGRPEAVEPPAPRQTMNEWGASPIAPAGPPAPTSSGSSPGMPVSSAGSSAGRQRPTMSDWGTQVGSFDSPPPITSSPQGASISPIEQLPAAPPVPAEPPRSTLHEWSGSSGSSVAMKPLFSGPASSDSSPLMQQPGGVTVRLGGDPGPESPPPSTPPLFTGNATDYKPEPPTPAQMDELPLPGAAPLAPPISMAETPRTFTEPMGFAWSWSASASPPPGEPPPEPRPSPSLAPRADSAWDQRSNPGIKLEAVVGRDKALDLIASDSKITRAPPTQKEEIQAILRGAKDLLELDDHTGAMELIRKAESIAPTDPEVVAMRERSEKTLLTMFESKLGKLEAIPRVLLKDDEIIWLNLDHRAGFVLAQIDGTVTFDDLFSVSGMTRIDTARILAQLVEEGVISRG